MIIMPKTLGEESLVNHLQATGVLICASFLALKVFIEFEMVERTFSHGSAGWRIDAAASLLAVVALSGFAALKAFELRAESDRRRAAEQRLAQLEMQDPLTGLANRNRMLEFLGQALQTRKTGDEVTGLLLIDLKRFTPINDAHGRAVGDRLLRMVAERLQSVAREDEMVARLGGGRRGDQCEHRAASRRPRPSRRRRPPARQVRAVGGILLQPARDRPGLTPARRGFRRGEALRHKISPAMSDGRSRSRPRGTNPNPETTP
jgi:hypothetical protein